MRKASLLISGIILCLALCLPLVAQEAAIVGTVRDPQQAVIQNATVTLTNVDTGVSLTTRTDVSGNYEFPVVKPGAYSLRVEQKGFETYIQGKFTLDVEQRARVDAIMRVGEASTLITVEAPSIGVQTESSSLGEVVESKRI